MSHTISAPQAARIAARTATVIANMRRDADAAEAAGDLAGAEALRTLADSRARAGARAKAGAKVVAA